MSTSTADGRAPARPRYIKRAVAQRLTAEITRAVAEAQAAKARRVEWLRHKEMARAAERAAATWEKAKRLQAQFSRAAAARGNCTLPLDPR